MLGKAAITSGQHEIMVVAGGAVSVGADRDSKTDTKILLATQSGAIPTDQDEVQQLRPCVLTDGSVMVMGKELQPCV